MAIKRDILVSILSSITVVSYGILTTFLLPHFISVKDYGFYRLFMLFVGYVGFFHLGMLDGIQLFFGGKDLFKLPLNEVSNSFYGFFCIEAFVCLAVVLYGLFSGDSLIVFFGLAIFSINGFNFFIYLYQSTGKIGEAALLNIAVYIILLAANLVCLFAFRLTNYMVYVVNQFSVFFLVLIFTIFRFQSRYHLLSYEKAGDVPGIIRKLVSKGFVLMLSNILYIGVLSLDKLFIRYNFSIELFSFYSFAFAVLVIGNSVFMAVGNSIFFHFRSTLNSDEIQLFFQIVISFISIGSSAVFFIAGLITNFLPKYESSIVFIRILIPSILPMALIGLIIFNMFKLEHKLWLLVKVLLAVNLVSLAMYFLVTQVYNSELSVAYSFTLTTYLLLLLSIFALRMKLNREIWVFILFYLVVYFATVSLKNNTIAVILYGSIGLFANGLLWRSHIAKLNFNPLSQKR